ncbi:MAG TPA: cysteine--tRNA ligase [Rhodospirillaceae bacterium]|nr:MAG: cysteine--tRNA ligase [Alphaproteobacteria bacterium GWF2_58_20]HAU29618.1 cysteine--tRNA ligase [Rhodospirillaceae bacterium]
MQIYNTATRSLETFIPAIAGKVGLYTCGPTVYSYAHIGNLRTYVFEDVLRRMLAREGYAVRHVMNVTDVGHLQSDADSGDDKMMVAALREQRSPWEIAQFYEAAFFRHAEMLGIMRPHVVARATEHIPEMIAFVEKLMALGFAYESGGNVYFDVSKFPRYADFARLDMKGARATDRAAFDDLKRSQVDFALWFSQSKFPNQIMQWDSPWGRGFPGWHIECSAMAMKYLGEKLDIHCGGVDHIPVHHTNEIAQSESLLPDGETWVNYWMHAAFLTLDQEKMAKSRGDSLTLDRLVEKGVHPLAYRYFLLTFHYRTTLRFSFEALEEAGKAYGNMLEKMQRLQGPDQGGFPQSRIGAEWAEAFWQAMGNDLNTPRALSIAWSVLGDERLADPEKRNLLHGFDQVLGLNLLDAVGKALSAEERDLVDQRQAARLRKDWVESDRLRDVLLHQHGIKVNDTSSGASWVRILPAS